MILGTAGHIDHGKTALVRALTGIDTDRLPEEKRRGITIDLGFAPLVVEGAGTIGIVDVPGHEGFIRTMLAGASGIDLAMLVIAADEGVMPQTREHLEILSLLEIEAGVIALTKSDLVDDDWLALVQQEVRTLCAGTLLENAEMIPVSALTGRNVDELRSAIGRCARSVTRTRSTDLFRLPIDRAFTVKGTGTVVTGTIWSGSVARDSMLRILPQGKAVRVRAVQSHGSAVDTAFPGTRAAVALAGCEVTDVERGSTIVSSQEWMPSRELDVSLRLIDRDFSPTPRTRVRIHIGTSETGARLSRLRAIDADHMVSRLILDEPVAARGRDRFVIRLPSPARTVGGGEVLDPFPPPHKQRRPIADVPSPNLEQRIARMLDAAGPMGLEVSILPIRTGFSDDEVRSALAAVNAEFAGDRVISPDVSRQLEDRIAGFVSVEMANHLLEPGVSLQTLRSSVHAPQEVIDLVVNRLVESGRIEVDGSLVRPKGWDSRLNEREQSLSDAIMHAICIQPLEPPSVAELEAKFGRTTVALLRRLERQGEVERVSEDRYYSRGALAQMVGSLRSSLEPGRKYSPSELRDVLGVSRKYLIPFLEFCDKRGVTERNDAGRVLRRDRS